MNLLFLLPDLEYTGDARQATLLAAALPRDRFRVEVLSMKGDGPFGDELRRAGVPLHGNEGERFFDIEDWLGLRRLLAERRPDAVHAWGLESLRALRVAMLGRWKRVPPLAVSSVRPRKLGWWDRRLLRRASRVVAADDAERHALIAGRIDPERVAVVPPAVRDNPPPADPDALRRDLGIPAGAPLVACAGRMDSFEDFRNAVWAFDVLKYLRPDLHFLLVGDGPARPRLEKFSRAIGHDDYRVVYAGARPDAATLLHLADVVWVPNRAPGGTNVALEAMAAGKPVVASALPNLAAVVRDGETGVLVSPHDPPALARATRRLLNEPALARALGEAARTRARAAFAVAPLAERAARVYDDLTPAALTGLG